MLKTLLIIFALTLSANSYAQVKLDSIKIHCKNNSYNNKYFESCTNYPEITPDFLAFIYENDTVEINLKEFDGIFLNKKVEFSLFVKYGEIEVVFERINKMISLSNMLPATTNCQMEILLTNEFSKEYSTVYAYDTGCVVVVDGPQKEGLPIQQIALWHSYDKKQHELNKANQKNEEK